MPQATKKRSPPTQTARLYRRCPACDHVLVEVVSDGGELLELDTSLASWVISGRETETGHHVVVQGRGYPLHTCPLAR